VDINQSVPFQLLDQAIGIDLEIISNDFQETPGGPNHSPSTYQEIVFQIKEEEPDLSAIGVLYALSLMSFSYAAPRGYSAEYFIPDYVSGRMMKTDILFQSGGKVNLSTRNRGRGAERWLTHLQGKKHIHVVEK
jgi:hypothetical protein